MITELGKVKKWASIDISDTLLHLAFTGLTNSALSNVYLPVKTPTSSGMPDEYTYTKIGYDTDDIADYYETLYGENYFAVSLIKEQVSGETPYASSLRELTRMITNIYKINEPKYLKMIELLGYEWNPLWNVDGTEEYSYLENQGYEDVTKQMSYTAHTDNTTSGNTRTGSVSESGSSAANHSDTEQVTTFDSPEWNDTTHNSGNENVTSSSNTTTYNSVADNGSGSVTYGAHTDTDTTTITHHNALNGSSEYSGGTDTFGNTVTGGDKYHTDKRIRKGNIGVTKTTELIRDAIETYRFEILKEFFDDLNQIILVRLFDLD